MRFNWIKRVLPKMHIVRFGFIRLEEEKIKYQKNFSLSSLEPRSRRGAYPGVNPIKLGFSLFSDFVC